MKCEVCNGTGGTNAKPCLECDGSGHRCDVCGEACEVGADLCEECRIEKEEGEA